MDDLTETHHHWIAKITNALIEKGIFIISGNEVVVKEDNNLIENGRLFDLEKKDG